MQINHNWSIKNVFVTFASAILFVDTDIIIYAYHVTGGNLNWSPSALFVNAINLISVGYRKKKYDILDVKNKTLFEYNCKQHVFGDEIKCYKWKIPFTSVK